MKAKIPLLLFGFFVLLLGMIACDKDKDPDPNDGLNHYLMAASYGDLITMTIDRDQMTYSFHNETTSESGNGALTLSTNPYLKGIYETMAGTKVQYTVELPGVVAISSMPMGNTANKLCFGISSDIHQKNNYTFQDLAGEYIFINFDDDELEPGEFWGGAKFNVDGSYTWGFGDADIEAANSIKFSGNGSGTLTLSSTDKSKMIFTEGIYQVTGSIYPGKLLLMDNGPGNGFAVGVAYPSTPVLQSSMAGTYKFIDIAAFAGQGVGYFTLPASGQVVTYYAKYNDGSEFLDTTGVTIESFERVQSLNNVYKLVQKIDDGGGTQYITSYMILLPGELLMYFTLEYSSSLGKIVVSSYGIGAKTN